MPLAADGKFLRAGDERLLVKGVTYGTFAPDSGGYQFPPLTQVAEDFRLMAELGINSVRTYTAPRRDLLDEAARYGLRVMIGLPWSQHVAFLDNRGLKRQIRRELTAKVAELNEPTLGEGESLAELRTATYDREALAARGLGFEKLDQLAMEHLLGVR